MHELSASLIREYVDIRLSNQDDKWFRRGHGFSLISYSKWAADELLVRIMEESFRLEPRTSVEIVEDFIDEMDVFIELSSTERPDLIFTIAKEIAEHILYFLKDNKYCSCF